MSWLTVALATALAVALLAPAIAAITRPARRPTRAPDVAVTGRHRHVQIWRCWTDRRARRRPIEPDVVADWCDALARSLRSGSTLRAALVNVAPNDPTLALRVSPFVHAIERGAAVSEAVDTLATRASSRSHDVAELRLAAAVLAVSGSIGGPAASSLDRVAGALRLRAADRAERSAHSAQARLSAHVLTVVPLGLLALLAGSDPDVRAFLGTPIGTMLVLVGLGLNGVGWWWMHHIIETSR